MVWYAFCVVLVWSGVWCGMLSVSSWFRVAYGVACFVCRLGLEWRLVWYAKMVWCCAVWSWCSVVWPIPVCDRVPRVAKCGLVCQSYIDKNNLRYRSFFFFLMWRWCCYWCWWFTFASDFLCWCSCLSNIGRAVVRSRAVGYEYGCVRLMTK